jgi:hypothetical protein
MSILGFIAKFAYIKFDVNSTGWNGEWISLDLEKRISEKERGHPLKGGSSKLRDVN